MTLNSAKKIAPCVSKSKTVLDSVFKTVDFWILDCNCEWYSVPWLYHGLQSQGFWILQATFSRRIQDSTNNNFRDSGFHKQKFPGYRNPLHVGKELRRKTFRLQNIWIVLLIVFFFILWYCSLFCTRWHIFTSFFVKKMIIPHDGFSFFGFDDQVALMTVLSEVALPIFSSRPCLKWAAIGRRVTSRYLGSKLSGSQQ